MAGSKVGKVTHYFDRIGVAVVELNGTLSVGDRILFMRRGEVLFEQEVQSLQIEHQNIASAKKGDDVALKVDQEVKKGAEIHKVSAA